MCRRPEQIKDWIDAVFKNKRFFDASGYVIPPQAVMVWLTFDLVGVRLTVLP